MSERKAAKRKAPDDFTQPVQATDGNKDSIKLNDDGDVTDTIGSIQCTDDSNPAETQHQRNCHHSLTTKDKLEQLKIWERVLKDEYVRKHLTQCINASDLLVYFHYMPRSWADKIKAVHTNQGQSIGAEELLDALPKLADGENNWGEDLQMGLEHSGHDLLVKLLDETYNDKKRTGHDLSPDDLSPGGPGESIIVGAPGENFREDISPATRAVCQHRELWIRTFRENRKVIIECIDPIAMLPYLPYLPRDCIRAVCENQGQTRGADVFLDKMFLFTDRAWMKDFIDALRSPRINQHLVADLLTSHFGSSVEKTENDPNYKDLHSVYAKSYQQTQTGQDSMFIYYGAKDLNSTDFGGS